MPAHVPYIWCDPTCPRQATNNVADCECGGARKQFEAEQKARQEAAKFLAKRAQDEQRGR